MRKILLALARIFLASSLLMAGSAFGQIKKSRRITQVKPNPYTIIEAKWRIDFSDLPSQRTIPEEPDERDWKSIGLGGNQQCYYNETGIVKNQNGTTRIWMKTKYMLDSGREEIIKQRSTLGWPTTGYKDYVYSFIAYEVNCVLQKIRVVSWVDYNSYGKVLDSKDGEGRWLNIVPQSVGYQLSQVACSR